MFALSNTRISIEERKETSLFFAPSCKIAVLRPRGDPIIMSESLKGAYMANLSSLNERPILK
jgi:hypothetical protein